MGPDTENGSEQPRGHRPIIKGPPIDYENEPKANLLTSKQFARSINTSFRTVDDWMTRGRLSQDRRVRVVLQHVFLPKGRVTTITAYKHFLSLLSTPSELFWMPDLPFVRSGKRIFWQVKLNDLKWICRHLPANDPLRNEAHDILTQCEP